MTKKDTMQRLTPCLWFNDNAEKAVNLYTSIFRNSKITPSPTTARPVRVPPADPWERS
jgi:predicted 3-demethylubiquinone-9 3-methyltransferase (glyoxalase superfamily)